MSDEGFLARWARRKAEVQSSAARPHPSPLPEGEGEEVLLPSPSGRGVEGEGAVPPPPPPAPIEPPPPPTLADVAQLTPDSDYTRFLAPSVDEGVKRAAMKKLFSDPHFNVMDGLDTYIADYGQPDPIPPSMLRQMSQSKFLGLFEDEDKKTVPPEASPDGAAAAQLSQSSIAPPTSADEDPDLQLQQHDAAGPGSAGGGAGA